MNLTKGQIGLIINMINCEINDFDTVYNMSELIVLKSKLLIINNEENLAKDEKCEGCKYEYLASWDEPCKYCIDLSRKE